ncbi:MAG: glyceraldehyde 3-phosphate dehydrogenase NAD-binding domain-containing protein, partial [Chitinophagaceae bacterium]
MRIAINGMGRIGRLLFRKLVDHPDIELIAVNDIMPTDNLAYLLKYDSVYGTFDKKIIIEDHSFVVNRKKIAVLQTDHPSKLPWKKMEIDVVLECSGKFTSRIAAEEHIKAGAKKVLLSTTGADDIPLMIYGYNQS